LSESQKIVYMGHRRYIPMKQQIWSMNDNSMVTLTRGILHRIS
jgi:hypothetical protein